MTRRRGAPVLGIGVLGIGGLGMGLLLLGIAMVMALQTLQEARIGHDLIETGASAQALVVTADSVERAPCPLICTPAVGIIATVVYEVAGLRSGAEIRLTSEEYEAYVAGDVVFIDLFYLPADPVHVERTPGARLAAATGGRQRLYILAGIGILCAAIGSIALFVARKRARALSTGPDG